MKWLKTRTPTIIAPRGPKGKRLYAIGDVHGCLKHLIGLMAVIESDNLSKPSKPTFIVFLGDLVDRGPDSAGVIEWVKHFTIKNTSCHCLMGNHEEFFLESLKGDLSALDAWLMHGGKETLLSYGISEALLASAEPEQILIKMKKLVPLEHRQFLEGLTDSIEFGDYHLVHAGVDPSRPIAEQDVSALRWIREPFLSHDKPLEKVIIHGHTIKQTVEFHGHRIGVDTGAYKTGKLSALCIEDDKRDVLDWFGAP